VDRSVVVCGWVRIAIEKDPDLIYDERAKVIWSEI
jgi:hypothetical protein